MVSVLAMLLLLPFEVYLAAGDTEYTMLRYAQAESLYVLALTVAPERPEILWRLARLCVSIADVSPDAERERLYQKAEQYARACIEQNEQIAEGHTWLAAALGNIAMFEGGATKVKLARTIYREVQRAIELNPNDDIAYSILGSFYRALGGVSWIERQLANMFLGGLPDGGYREAVEALENAIALAPDVMRHRYELGMVYLDWGRKVEAKAEFLEALQLPVTLRSDTTRIAEMRDIISRLPD
jgi:tetratricopeptide (TPR) repeat protein